MSNWMLQYQDMIEPLEKIVEKVKLDIVYSHFIGVNNRYHRAAFQSVRVVLRPHVKVTSNKWCLYEVPSSTDQSPPIKDEAFLPNYYVDISKIFEKKMENFCCYKTEVWKTPNPRVPEMLEALTLKGGAESAKLKAEAFMVVRDGWY